MVQKNILVSILINNFNNQKYIKKSIYSTLNQNYKNIEIIVYDDKSTDNSKRIIDGIKSNKLIKIYNKCKKTNSASLNQLNAIYNSFDQSKGDIIFLLDGDDFFSEQKVKSIVDIFNKNKHINFIQDNPTYYFPKTKKMKLNKLKTKIFPNHTWPYFNPTSTMVFKRKFLKYLLKEIRFSKSDYKNIFFDARAFIYIHFFEKKFIKIDESFTFYTQNELGDTISKYKNKNLIWWKRRKEYHQYVSDLFKRKKKFHLKLFDYYLTNVIVKFFNLIIK